MLCFRKFLTAKKIMDKKREKYQDFGSKIYCLTVPKTFVGEHFRMSLMSSIETFYAYEGYFKIFLRILIVSQY